MQMAISFIWLGALLLITEILIESWRVHYNTQRPHSSLGYRPPAPEILLWPASPALGSARPATQPVAPGTPLN